MKKSIIISALLLNAFVMMGKDIKTAQFTTTPQMHCQNCENKIKKNLRFEKGIKLIETSIPDQTVTIKYDADKTSTDKIKEGFKKIGYEARVLKAGEKVKKEDNGSCSNM